MFLRRFTLLLSLGLGLALSACSPAPERRYGPAYSPDPSTATSASIYVLGVHPLHSPKCLFEVYQPLVDYLNDRLKGASLRFEASTDYAAFEAKFARRQVPLALRMELSRFERATNASDQPVIDFIDRFERELRPVRPGT